MLMEVIVEYEKIRGKLRERRRILYGVKREDSCITQNDAYGIKELFERHAAGNIITAQEWKDTGNGAQDFSEMSPLDKLDGDLTDIDIIESYITDYNNRYKQAKENGKQKQQKPEEQQPEG